MPAKIYKQGMRIVKRIVKKSIRHAKNALLYVSILAVVIFAYVFASDFGRVAAFRYDLVRCIDYLANGTLYTGEVNCSHGPVSYWVGFLIRTAFGSEYLQAVTSILIILLNFGIFLQILWLSNARRKAHIFLLLFAYVFLILQFTVGELPTLLAIFLALFAIYFMFKSGNTLRFILSGFLFALACLAKFTALPAFAAALLVLVYFGLRASRSAYQIFFDLGLALIPFLTAMIAVRVLYPNIFIYSVWALYSSPGLTILQGALLFIINPLHDLRYLVLILLLVLALLIFYKIKSQFALLFLFSVLPAFAAVAAKSLEFPLLIGGYYNMLSMIFLIIAIGELLKLQKIKHKKLAFASSIMLIILIPLLGNFAFFSQGFKLLDSSLRKESIDMGQQRYTLRLIIEKPYTFINFSDGKILINDEISEILEAQGLSTKGYANVIQMDNPPEDTKYFDTRYLDELYSYGMLASAHLRLNQQEIELSKRINNREFQTILIGPLAPATMIMFSLKASEPSVVIQYCIVAMPSLLQRSGGRHLSYLLFDKKERCDTLIQKAEEYYEENFEVICRTDQWVANYVVKTVFSTNQKQINKACAHGGNLISRFEDEEKIDYTNPFFVMVCLLGFTLFFLHIAYATTIT
jgi:hypothetical protein